MIYTPLQVKTNYSLLQSLNETEKLISTAKDLGYESLAITDHNNMFAVCLFYQTCLKYGIKPIIGIELTVNDSVVLLYAINNLGYNNLIKLSTIVSERELTKEDLILYRDNLVLVMPYKHYNKDIFDIYDVGYVGYSTRHECDKIKGDKVFINDVSYIDKDDYKYLDYLYMIKELKVLGEYELGTHKGRHLLRKEELSFVTNEVDINNTKVISDMCNVEIGYIKDLLPVYDEKIDSYEYLKYLCNKGLLRRLSNKVDERYKVRLEKELDIIRRMNFCDYFLIVWDYVKYAKQHNILVGPGRGSAAGSLVSYTLGIIDIDPIKYDLLFERFLNPERITMPDIDIDFDSEKRQDVINYVLDKYGCKKVCGIITFDTLSAKQVVRDVGRILDLSQQEVDNIVKQLSNKESLKETLGNNVKLRRMIDDNAKYKRLFDIALHLEGNPRNIGLHASGIVISRVDIDNVIPLYKSNRGLYTTGYSMNYLEPLGLLKMDFLGISNLTLIQEVITNIRDNTNYNITFSNIPLDDKKTFEIFKSAKTDGIFQFESFGMRRFLEKLQVENFDDLVAALALYRPGAMGYIDNYIKRRNGKERVEYPDPSLEDILKPTYGIIIYQEQIIQIVRAFAGYTLGEADILRRAISKKKSDILENERPKFIEKSVKKGHSKESALNIYNIILKFANYGFNKSHSVGYAMVAYKMAFLKTYFFEYFEVAILNNAIGNLDKTKVYLMEAKQRGINILYPDINNSTDKYRVVGNNIICPLSIIKNVGVVQTKNILDKRGKGGYLDFIDFMVKNYNSSVLDNNGLNRGNVINKKIVLSLIKAGCFDSFNVNVKTLINNLDNIINYAELCQNAGMIEVSLPSLEYYEDYSSDEKIDIQFEVFGFYLSNHPVSNYRSEFDIEGIYLEKYFNRNVQMVLYVDNIREVVTKNNDTMAFVKGVDEYREVSLTMFPKVYKQYNNIKKKDIIRVFGRVEKRFEQYQIIVNSLKVLNN